MSSSRRGRRNVAFALAVIVAWFAAGCATVSHGPSGPWDETAAEVLTWEPDDPGFAQDFALETSGLAFAGAELVAPSEKYARLLIIDHDLGARVVVLGVPRHAELEGVAWNNGTLYLCDEAHAAVYRVGLGEATRLLPKLAAVELPIEGVELEGGKVGVEGIEVSKDGRFIFLLLERTGNDEVGCVSRLWQLGLESDRLVAAGEPVDIQLEDCNWRLTGLAWMGQRLLGLKTQYPGSRYEIVEVDPGSGAVSLVQDLTEYLRGVRGDGWGNNVEGIAVAADGALWLISDNAVTGVVDDFYPPKAVERALLVRMPRRSAPSPGDERTVDRLP